MKDHSLKHPPPDGGSVGPPIFLLLAWVRLTVLAVFLLTRLDIPATGQSPIFHKVVSSGNEIPGMPGSLFATVGGSDLSEGRVVFGTAYTCDSLCCSPSCDAVFLYDGNSIRKVADIQTPDPETTGTLRNFLGYRCGFPYGIFQARESSLGPQDYYRFDVGNLSFEKIPLRTQPIAGGSGTFTGVSNAEISGNHLAFIGTGSSGQQGVYRFDLTAETVVKVADLNTPAPGDPMGRNFTFFSSLALDGDRVLFLSGVHTGLPAEQVRGLYLFDGELSRLVDTNTPRPDIPTQNFGAPQKFLFDLERVYFQSSGAIFVWTGSVFDLVVRNDQTIPGGGNRRFRNISLAGAYQETVAFSADDHLGGPVTVYVAANGQIEKLIASGELLNGMTTVSVNPLGVDNSDLLVFANLEGGPQRNLFLTDIGGFGQPTPEPTDTPGDETPTSTPTMAETTGTPTVTPTPTVTATPTRTVTQTPAPTQDTDGDGIPDVWESIGFDLDGDGTIDLDLPAMGADPMRKDIFLEIDYMVQPFTTRGDTSVPGHSHKPKRNALNALIVGFLQSGVDNPDGSKGIAIHIDAGPDTVMNPRTGELWGSRSRANNLPHTETIGSKGFFSGDYNWAEFDGLKGTGAGANFSLERSKVFHYCIFAHKLGGFGTTSGISRGIGGSDFLVTLGAFDTGVGTALDQAGTLIHELGHNLGLRHGGNDSVHHKPNYLSSMNYLFQFRGIIRDGRSNVVNYSNFGPSDLPALDEQSLNEGVGLGGSSDIDRYGTRFICAGQLIAAATANGPLDWNCDGNPMGVGVAADVNGSENGEFSTLTSYHDWSNLVYDGGEIGPNSAKIAPPLETEVDELTLEQHRALGPQELKVTVIGPGPLFIQPGTTQELPFTIANLGMTADMYLISASSTQGWADLGGLKGSHILPKIVAYNPGDTQTIKIPVTIPGGQSLGSRDEVCLVARSGADPGLVDEVCVEVVVDAAGPPRFTVDPNDIFRFQEHWNDPGYLPPDLLCILRGDCPEAFLTSSITLLPTATPTPSAPPTSPGPTSTATRTPTPPNTPTATPVVATPTPVPGVGIEVFLQGDGLIDFSVFPNGSAIPAEQPSFFSPGTYLTDQFASVGVTFRSTKNPFGSPLSNVGVGVLGGAAPFANGMIHAPPNGLDGRTTWEVVFETPVSRAGIRRLQVGPGGVTNFYREDGALLATFTTVGDFDMDFHAVSVGGEVPGIKRIELTGNGTSGSQVGLGDDLLFRQVGSLEVPAALQYSGGP